ncbi:MAG: RdgB/HAM1 family non-canonical purine NTP pyrophosphatase [Candidatus Aminicenantes bacterium]|nr:RdgB/HAM1 family non-canonical purine NTP pyrophosphatase [Candidatus Aminicenantes bacterium]
MLRNKLLLATTNQGKANEIKSFLRDFPLEIFTLRDLNLKKTFQERGKTFAENAKGKSLFYSEHWEGLTLAEDSGLEIEHLNGAPGVISARFSGPQATDEKNNQKLLELMKEVPSVQRKARFVSCMILAQKGKIIKEIKETAEGLVASEQRGSFGFGYDPIFYYPPLGKTFAELLPEEKNRVSHRGQALKKLKEFLIEYLDSPRS